MTNYEAQRQIQDMLTVELFADLTDWVEFIRHSTKAAAKNSKRCPFDVAAIPENFQPREWYLVSGTLGDRLASLGEVVIDATDSAKLWGRVESNTSICADVCMHRLAEMF